MTLTPMRFSGYTWHHNPKTIRTEYARSFHELEIPYGSADVRNMGERARVVEGTGELYGFDCLRQFHALRKLFERGEKGVLSIPGVVTAYAYFRSLRLVSQPREDVLEYAFSFVEAQNGIESAAESIFYDAVEGESLWDVAYRYNLSIDEAVRMNPQIRFIDVLKAGERIRVC